MLSKETLAQNLAMLAEVYEKPLTNTLINVYYAVLQDMSDEDFKQAIRRLLQERTFATFPKPAEILERTQIKQVAMVQVDQTELKAKELIKLAHSMNSQIFRDSEHMGVTFDDLLEVVEFPTVSESDIAILEQVKPHYSVKLLVKNINTYQTSVDELQAFKSAIKQSERKESLTIGHDVRKMLEG